MTPYPIRWLSLVSVAAALFGCGGGGETSSSSSTTALLSDTVVAKGTVTGFGSVIVEGVRYDDTGASVSIDDTRGAPRSASLGDLKLGMRVDMDSDGNQRARTIIVSPEVQGLISSLTASGFVIAGQTVRVSADPAAPTVFEGVAGLSGLAVKDFVEVHGARASDGAIVASRIERKDPGSYAAIRVAGTLSSLDTVARSFKIGGLQVNYGAAQLLPTGVVLASGQRVAVWSDQLVEGSILTAKSVQVRASGLANNDTVRASGLVAALDTTTRSFSLGGVKVNYSSASFPAGQSASLLAADVRVRVSGVYVEGVLQAAQVTLVRDSDHGKAELKGAVTDFISVASFKVRGVPVDASGTDGQGAGIFFKNGSIANLANGVFVEIEGPAVAGVVKPSKIDFENDDDHGSRWVAGPVTAVSADGFTVKGISMKLAPERILRKADGSAALPSDIVVGVTVRARGMTTAGVLTVTELVIMPAGFQSSIDDVEGIASEVNVAAGTFKLNGTLVRYNPALVPGLANGVRVEVKGNLVNGEILANQVEVEHGESAGDARVRGLVTDYVSTSSFKVAGQAVDASGAQLEIDGPARTLANGRFVEVRGTMIDGVLKAVKVEIKG